MRAYREEWGWPESLFRNGTDVIMPGVSSRDIACKGIADKGFGERRFSDRFQG
ncbi:hypothetical protein GOB87_04105 [Acetobacter estunensis]|uniref:Uncharacterized protein n=1 Tax=Acetobacter estunensis TaxID=104097 RepID=A0A967B4Q4_9PROT|nr:hypothetical protein [Acetobacter estunensis]NHO53144.1 hypothetical protein [Acetobacter estunensis]